MLPNQNHITPATGRPTIAAATNCDKCGVKDTGFLHNVRNQGNFRHLCTSCILRLHPKSFCPTCFTVYQTSPPNADVTCKKCSSVSHSSCVHLTPNYPYICPMCVNPNSPIYRRNHPNAARILAAAASISSLLMTKAAESAKSEAERRAVEAVYKRERAKRALEHVAIAVVKENMKRNKGSVIEVGRPSVGGNAGCVMDRRGSSNNHNNVGNGGGGVGRNEFECREKGGSG